MTMGKSGHLLQLSGVVIDLIYRVQAVPVPGAEALVHDMTLTPGGGFNAMVAAHRAGMRVSCAAPCGTGPLADMARAGMAAQGIAVLGAQGDADQGCCTVLVDDAGERTFIAKEGAESQITPAGLARIDAVQYDWIMLSGYALVYDGSRDTLADWIVALPGGATVILDPSPLVGHIAPAILSRVLPRLSWISANAQEAAMLTGHADPVMGAAALAQPRTGALVRLGGDGCLLALPDHPVLHIPAHPVRAIDTNGAGDAHLGAFIAAMAAGQTPQNAARFANVAAALSTTKAGPATSPDLATITETLRGLP
jgi:sugar/nucleoside kinase (ribokinase family)